jgi:hypothetical protein
LPFERFKPFLKNETAEVKDYEYIFTGHESSTYGRTKRAQQMLFVAKENSKVG